MLIDAAFLGVRNVFKKETQKTKDPKIEIQRVWNIKIKAISVIMGASGTISKSFRKYKSNILEEHESRIY